MNHFCVIIPAECKNVVLRKTRLKFFQMKNHKKHTLGANQQCQDHTLFLPLLCRAHLQLLWPLFYTSIYTYTYSETPARAVTASALKCYYQWKILQYLSLFKRLNSLFSSIWMLLLKMVVRNIE